MDTEWKRFERCLTPAERTEEYMRENNIPFRFCPKRNRTISKSFCQSMICGEGCPDLAACQREEK